MTCGVSVQEVRERLLTTIPGLAEHGLSKTSVKYSNQYIKGVDPQSFIKVLSIVKFQGRITVEDKVTNIHITFMHALT